MEDVLSKQHDKRWNLSKGDLETKSKIWVLQMLMLCDPFEYQIWAHQSIFISQISHSTQSFAALDLKLLRLVFNAIV